MKSRILFFILLIVATLSLSAQQEDSIKIKFPSPVIQLKSSLLPNKSNLDNLLFIDSTLYQHPFTFSEPITTVAQRKTNLFNASYSKFIIPAALISYGVLTRGNKHLLILDHSTSHEVDEHLKVPIPIDDYSQFAPALSVYGLDMIGIKAKHNLRDRTILLASSYMIMGATVQTLKSSANVWRPDHSNNNSFPSGHTATAFVGAHILFLEYKDVSPWIGIGGYTVATGTGVFRVLNKKHWVSDIVTGAGIGILSAEAGYLLLPMFHKAFHLDETNKHLAIAPSVGDGSYGIGVVLDF